MRALLVVDLQVGCFAGRPPGALLLAEIRRSDALDA